MHVQGIAPAPPHLLTSPRRRRARRAPRAALALVGLVACADLASGDLDAAPLLDAAIVDAAASGDLCGLTYSAYNDSPEVMAQSTYAWTCSGGVRRVTGTGIPDHPVVGGRFATPISTQNVSVTFPLAPTVGATATPAAMNVGYALNSVKFDPATAGSCASDATSTAPGDGCVAAMGTGPWRLEALGGAFMFGTDDSNAHVQPNGQYHYHGIPEGILTRLGRGQAMTLVGYATDGFPIYARYGYTDATDATSAVKVMTGSWQKKASPDAGRPSVTVFPMGTFTQDYEYVAGSGDLDECNGRTGVTPEFPGGTYHYFITDSYPYIQRCVKGQ
ncbi:MAG: YHYH protein [Kofleriaceae bacterium]